MPARVWLLITALLLLLLTPTVDWAQNGPKDGGGKGKGGKGKGGRMNIAGDAAGGLPGGRGGFGGPGGGLPGDRGGFGNPNASFDRLPGGGPSQGFPAPGGQRAPGFEGPSRDGRGGPGGWNNPNAAADWADGMFRRADQNGDGLLNYDEMPEALRIERDKWDANLDGFVDLAEFKLYFQARMQMQMAERAAGRDGPSGPGGSDLVPPEDEERKPVVYRVGNLPRELPEWFRQMDTDADAQVGLYEWKTSRRPLDEFQGMDRNNDGFLTVEEVLRTVVRGNNRSGDGGPGRGGNGFGRSDQVASARGAGEAGADRGGFAGGRGGFGGAGMGGNRGEGGFRGRGGLGGDPGQGRDRAAGFPGMNRGRFGGEGNVAGAGGGAGAFPGGGGRGRRSPGGGQQ